MTITNTKENWIDGFKSFSLMYIGEYLMQITSMYFVMFVVMVCYYSNGGKASTEQIEMFDPVWIVIGIIFLAPMIEEYFRGQAIEKNAGIQYTLLLILIEFIVYFYPEPTTEVFLNRMATTSFHICVLYVNIKFGWKKAMVCHSIWNIIGLTIG